MKITDRDIRTDPAGDGHYGAPRGFRKHIGCDYCYQVGEAVSSPVSGEVTKLGYPYGDDLQWRYVEVTDAGGDRHRLFYVEPAVQVGDQVSEDDTIGNAQDISLRYPGQGMLAHVHYEILDTDNQPRDPTHG